MKFNAKGFYEHLLGVNNLLVEVQNNGKQNSELMELRLQVKRHVNQLKYDFIRKAGIMLFV